MRTVLVSITTLALLCLAPTTVAAEEEAAPGLEPATYFTGTFMEGEQLVPDPVPNPDTGVLEVRDGWLEYTSQGIDPRIEGLYRVEPFAMDIDPTTGAGRMWGVGHTQGEEGTFEGPIWGIHYPITEEISGFVASGWLTGTGEYEGLTYFYVGTFDGEEAFIEGMIYEGEAPPLQ